MSRLLKKFFQDFNLWNLDDTDISSPTQGQIITYDEILGKFKNMNLDLSDQAELEAFSDDPESSTTSNGWVTKLNETTVDTKTAGRFLISHSAQIGQSDKEKTVAHRVQWRPGTGGTWQTLIDVRNALSTDGAFDPRTGFNIVDLTSDNVISVRTQFGQTDDGGTGFSKFNTVIVQRIGDLIP